METPLWKELTFHHFGLILSAVFGLISVVVAFFLIFKHATHYLKPWEQKHIIRILLMIPIYSVVSFLSYLYYRHAIYFEVLRDCYEAFAISAFFTLLCHYIAPNLHEQKDYFRTLDPIKNWFWGVFGLQRIFGNENKGILRKPRSGLTWFNVRFGTPEGDRSAHEGRRNTENSANVRHRSSGLVFSSTASSASCSRSCRSCHKYSIGTANRRSTRRSRTYG